MEISQVEKYVTTVIPNLERELVRTDLGNKELLELYNLYVEVLRIVAPYDFATFNKYLELDEDSSSENRAFYNHRKNHIGEIFQALNDMEVYDKYDLVLISLAPRVGKALRNTEIVLTENGWEQIQNIKVGDKVYGSNGNTTNVLGVFPQGVRDIYKVTFDDDTSVECDIEHLWTVQTRSDRRCGKERTITTADIMKNLYVDGGNRKNYSIKYVKPINFKSKLDSKLDLSPYLLGALIGDGSIKKGVKFTNIDSDIIDKVESLLPNTDKLSKISNTISCGISKKEDIRNEFGYLTKSWTQFKLESYGLYGKLSDEKFIPKQYLYANVDERLELLRGLMDTDGSVGDKSYMEYSTVSEQLSKDVVELIRSLGGRCTITNKVGKLNGVSHKVVYRIVFNMELNPFYCERKKVKFKPRTTRKYKYIKSIEKVDSDYATCILVDDAEHLFVTNGYNLTHNTTTGIRFLSWICGRHPENTQLATSYSDAVTGSFYIGVMEVLQHERYKEVFTDTPVVYQNAKKQEIWVKVMKRYPTISFVSVGGSMTGRAEAGNYLYCDDLVNGLEEALSITRLEKLWGIYTVNCKQRKKDGCKEIHIATRWSVHDPITKLAEENADNPRCKIISVPCYNEEGESNFDFLGGFGTAYYKELQSTMDEASFNALYLCEPIEREGLLYLNDELQYYFELPDEQPDTIVAICDSKNMGTDFVCSPIGYVYGDFIFVEDVVYNDGLPDITRPLVAEKWVEHKVIRADVEMNNGGNYYAEDLDKMIHDKGGKTSIRTFFSSNNKRTKIITYSDYVKKHFVFKDKSKYSPNSEYAKFMKALLSWTQSGKNKNDDSVDSIAMLAQLVQDLNGSSIKILDRRALKL